MLNNNIGKSVYILLALSIIALTMVGIISNVLMQKTSIQNNAHANMLNYSKQFDTHIYKETQTLTSLLNLISVKENLYSSFISSNKEKLFNDSKVIYDDLNMHNNITHLYFIKLNGEVFLRTHDYNRDSDIINRYTFLKAKETGNIFSGIEFGLKKNYTLRVVLPWIVKGKLIGYIEIGKEVDKLIQTISSQLGVEISIAIKKDEYKDTLELVKNRLKTFMQTKLQYIVYSTLKKNKKLISLFEDNELNKWITLENKNYISYISFLEDASKKRLGSTLFLVNITSQYNEFKSSLFYYVSIMIIGTILMLFLVYIYISRKQKELNSALEQIDVNMREKSSLLSLFEHGDSVLFKWNNDAHWSIEYVSSNVSNLLGYSKNEFITNRITYTDCIHKDDIANVIIEVENGSKSTENFFKHSPYRVVTKNKQIKWVLDYTVLIRDINDNITHYLGYIIDITEQEETLKNLEKFIDTQKNIVILTNGKDIQFVNKQFNNFFGYDNIEDFQKMNNCVCDYFVKNDKFFHLGKIGKNDNWLVEIQKLPKSQQIVAMSSQNAEGHAFSINVNKFEGSTLIVSFTDISETMLNQFELEAKTIHDTLTGAYNREYFEQNYKRFIKEQEDKKLPLAIALLDIDNFKLVNDEHGHDVGDAVLIEFVKRVQNASRDSDVFIRWGGEEFILILKIKEKNDLEKILEHVRKSIQTKEFNIIGTKTCSIGATFYKDSEDIEKTIKRADEAVYEAKENGRNKVVIKL